MKKANENKTANMPQVLDSDEIKSREAIKAEREERKKAKQAAKGKGKPPGTPGGSAPPAHSSPPSAANVPVDETDRAAPPGVDVVGTHQAIKQAGGGAGGGPAEKSKAELRAERRAKQEAQRAAKEAAKKPPTEVKQLTPKQAEPVKQIKKEVKAPNVPLVEKTAEEVKPQTTNTSIGHRAKLFGHLSVDQRDLPDNIVRNVHPSIVKLGTKYAKRVVSGSNARCIALLSALEEVINDYVTPAEKQFSRGLESYLADVMTYLNHFRPVSVSMTNAVRHLKSHLTQLPNDIPENEAKKKLCDVANTFIREQIDVAGKAISNSVQEKIVNGDTILVYACSSLLSRILKDCRERGIKFHVVVVDGGPLFEGREMLRRLENEGIKCTYILLSAVSFIMGQVTKVMLGAHALLANGCVMSRAGSALVALVAKNRNVPVLVCCETYKFCERVQADAFVYNELGRPDDFHEANVGRLMKAKGVASLSLLYDITPPNLVDAVVTEIAILPCTSVPVILRVKPSDMIA